MTPQQTRELDQLLEAFANAVYDDCPEAERKAWKAVVEFVNVLLSLERTATP